jgi:HEAT repeat protein
MKHQVAVLTLLIACAACCAAADAGSAGDKVRQTLLYGIDSQVLDAIKTLQTTKDFSYTRELSQILSDQRSTDVRRAVMDLFREQKLGDGEGAAKEILRSWEDTARDLVVAAIRYRAAISSVGLAADLAPLVDATDNAEALAAIQALGTNGDASSASLLVGKLKSADYPDARKNEVVLALGALKNAAAVDELLSIAGSGDQEKVRRLYAADSLGKIGDTRALPVLRAMLAEKDALVRLYAASALARFSLEEVFPSLLQGLRDENVKVREQSARALGRTLSAAQAEAAVPILSYKAELDPEALVRIASIQALGEIGGDAAIALLLKVFSGADHPVDSREAALAILAVKALPACVEAIRAVIKTEWTSFDTRMLESTARVLSTVTGTQVKEFLVLFLDSPDPVVRSYGIRGIALNRFTDLKSRVQKMADSDPNPGTRKEASTGLVKL